MWHRLLRSPSWRHRVAAATNCSNTVSTHLQLSSPFCCHHRWRSSDTSAKPFDRILIANRGEIALRVIRTCEQLGIETVAIYSTADAQAPFVRSATHAVCVGPTPSSQSYLNVDAILAAVQDTAAQAVHPGYGFLSENAAFATAVQKAGVVWLGPPPSAVTALGDKLESKRLAHQAGVDIIPGFAAPVESLSHALELCHSVIGYPVLLKAASGGGGKGMRVCYNDTDVRENWGLAQSEALKFFSDDRLLLEKFVTDSHHIEFQVLASAQAEDVVIFPERECSVQRRNQKIIEESPSCLLTAETRHKMAQQVKQLCQTVGYESAGTVEWLVDEEQNFYFLEMNTRLQVEHPVSEAICGVDLVKGMLWVGAGWGLPPEFQLPDDSLILPHTGHAVEARIYAEDPLRGFLPSTGPLRTYVEPSVAGNTPDTYVRLDSGVVAGQAITPHYDPLLSKVIAYAPTRRLAIAQLQSALDEYVIEGVQHNARLVQSVLRQADFLDGKTPTSFLPQHYPDGFRGVELTESEQAEFAVAAAVIDKARRDLLQESPLAGGNDTEDIVVVKLGGMFGTAYQVELQANGAIWSKLDPETGASVPSTLPAKIRLDSRDPLVYEPQRYLATLSLNGTTRSIQVLEREDHGIGQLWIQMYGAQQAVLIQSRREHELCRHMREPKAVDTSNQIQSPMPGTLLSVAVQPGDSVEAGQEVCLVEAMKMQNIIRSPRAGIISDIKVATGSSLMSDQIIMELEPVESAMKMETK